MRIAKSFLFFSSITYSARRVFPLLGALCKDIPSIDVLLLFFLLLPLTSRYGAFIFRKLVGQAPLPCVFLLTIAPKRRFLFTPRFLSSSSTFFFLNFPYPTPGCFLSTPRISHSWADSPLGCRPDRFDNHQIPQPQFPSICCAFRAPPLYPPLASPPCRGPTTLTR